MDEIENIQTVYALREAGLLELPFIYNLILSGSILGVFSDFFISSYGQVKLFKTLFRDLFLFPAIVGGKFSNRDFYIFMMDGRDIGFIALEDIKVSDTTVERHITECALIESFRHHKHGSHLIRMVVETASSAARHCAVCTPHAKEMQAILKKHGFTLREVIEIPGAFPLNHYVLPLDVEVPL